MTKFKIYDLPECRSGWPEGGLGITNFDKEKLGIYILAIQEYPRKVLGIGRAMDSMSRKNLQGSNLLSLIYLPKANKNGDLSDFWTIFHRIENEVENA